MGETKVKDLPAHQRPRERLYADGSQYLSEVQLLAIIIGSGTTKLNALSLARKILNQYPLKRLALINPKDLQVVSGVGEAVAARITAAFEIGRRAIESDLGQPRVTNPREALLLVNKLSDYCQEHLVVLYLDSRQRLLEKATIAVGSVNTTFVHPREIFAPAVRLPVSNIILVHNHPSGDTSPSEDDTLFTDRILRAGNILGVKLLDHLIVGGKGYFSFREGSLI